MLVRVKRTIFGVSCGCWSSWWMVVSDLIVSLSCLAHPDGCCETSQSGPRRGLGRTRTPNPALGPRAVHPKRPQRASSAQDARIIRAKKLGFPTRGSSLVDLFYEEVCARPASLPKVRATGSSVADHVVRPLKSHVLRAEAVERSAQGLA